MIMQKIDNKLHLCEKEIDLIKLCLEHKMISINEIEASINEIINSFLELNQVILSLNTFTKYINKYNDISNIMSDILVDIVESAEKEKINILSLQKLINIFLDYKEITNEIKYNSIDDLTKIYYENRTLYNKKYIIVYFQYDDNALLTPISLIEMENLKVDLIIINSIYSDEIKVILTNAGYDLNFIKLKEEIKSISEINKNPVISDDQYYELHNNLMKIDIDYMLPLKDSDITIISNNCWGAYLYKKCGKKYSSPLSWTSINIDDFCKLVSNLKHYLQSKLNFIVEEDIEFPIALLDDIKIYFPHFKSNKEAEDKWSRRLKNFNYNNILIQANIGNYEDAVKFDKLNIEKKVAFTPEEYNLKSCVYLYNWEKEKQDKNRYNEFFQYSHLRSWDDIDVPEIILK